MIIDNLKNCELYFGVNKNFEKAFEFIKKACNENLPVGKYEIDGKDVYAMVQEYDTKPEENGKFEGHRKYIDIQFIVSGEEKMELMDISKAVAKTEYNEERDFLFFENTDKANKTVFTGGEYGIFFPWDIHKPGLSAKAESNAVRKIVVKVKF